MIKNYSVNFHQLVCRYFLFILPITFSLSSYGQDGSLDLSFGNGGMVTTSFPGNTNADKGVKTLILPDGKIVTAGYINNASFLYKISSAGIPDTTFGINGISPVIPSLVVSDALLQNDGKIIIIGTGNEDGFGDVKLARFNSDGSLDKNFGINGVAIRSSSGYERDKPLMAIQPGGKIVIVKTAIDVNNIPMGIYDHDFLIFRFNANGTIDDSFGSNGTVMTDFNRYDEGNAKIVIQSDGKIIVTGTSNTCQYGTCFNGVIARYNENGTLDENFNGDGKLAIDFGNTFQGIYTVFPLKDDKLLLTGNSGAYDSNDINFLLARVNSNGTMDSTFGSDGIQRCPFNIKYLFVLSVLMQTDGKFVVGGNLMNLSDYTFDFVVCRFNADGKVDNTFNKDGIDTLDMSGYDSWNDYERLYSINLQADNKILAIGYASDALPNADFAIARIDTNGKLDTGFDGDGRLYLSYGQSETHFGKIIVQPDGKTLAVGWAKFGNSSLVDNFAVAKFNSDGTPDISFDIDGKKSISFYDSISCGGAEISLQPDNRIMVAGTTSTNNYASEIAIAKLNPDGSFDESFDSDGKLTVNLSTVENEYYSYSRFKILPNGEILIAGIVQPPSTNFRNIFIARLKTDGSLDETFNGTGKTIVNLNTNPEIYDAYNMVYGITLQADGKILVVGNTTNPLGTDVDMVVLRINDNGSLDSSFDKDGILILHFSDNWDQCLSVALQNDGKIIVGGSSSTESATYFALARLNPDGSLDNSFDGDGKQTTDMGPYWTDMINSFAIQPDGKIIAAGYTEIIYNGIGGGGLVRYNTNGSIDSSFGDNGKVLSPYAGYYGFCSPVIFNNQLYVCGEINEGISKGCIERFNLTKSELSIPSNISAIVLEIWPNPSQKQFTLKLETNSNEPIELKVFDMAGRQVYSMKGPADMQYQFGSEFLSGIYMTEVRQGNNRSTVKLIKQ